MEINITSSGKTTSNWVSAETNLEQVKKAKKISEEYYEKIKGIKFKRVQITEKVYIEVKEDISEEDLSKKVEKIKKLLI